MARIGGYGEGAVFRHKKSHYRPRLRQSATNVICGTAKAASSGNARGARRR